MQNIGKKILNLAPLMNYDRKNVSHDVTWTTVPHEKSFSTPPETSNVWMPIAKAHQRKLWRAGGAKLFYICIVIKHHHTRVRFMARRTFLFHSLADFNEGTWLQKFLYFPMSSFLFSIQVDIKRRIMGEKIDHKTFPISIFGEIRLFGDSICVTSKWELDTRLSVVFSSSRRGQSLEAISISSPKMVFVCILNKLACLWLLRHQNDE